MPVNPYFNHVTFVTEQNLIQDLIIEAIKIYGHESFYTPREDVAIDTILGEDGLSEYVTAYPVEIYLSTFDSFAGQSDFISKFGLHIEDQAKFLIAAPRFFEATNNTLRRPRENDLIYIEFTPDNRYLFEIRFVENKEKLFQLGKLYTYELRCEMMNFSHERIATGNTDVDTVGNRESYQIEVSITSNTAAFTLGETVYQGASFMESVGTGTVFAANSSTLTLKDITGSFNDTDTLVGVSSGATATPTSGQTVQTDPIVNDPIADNTELKAERETFIVRRGTNPITGQ